MMNTDIASHVNSFMFGHSGLGNMSSFGPTEQKLANKSNTPSPMLRPFNIGPNDNSHGMRFQQSGIVSGFKDMQPQMQNLTLMPTSFASNTSGV